MISSIFYSIKKFRNISLLMGGLLAMAILAGCQGPVVPYKDAMSRYPQIHLTSYSLQSKIALQEPLVSRVGDGQLDVVVPVRNLSGGNLYLEYQYYFTNAQGGQAEETSGWNTLRLPAYGIEQIHFTSLTAGAADFDLTIRRLP